jgi:hypothetical protein
VGIFEEKSSHILEVALGEASPQVAGQTHCELFEQLCTVDGTLLTALLEFHDVSADFKAGLNLNHVCAAGNGSAGRLH